MISIRDVISHVTKTRRIDQSAAMVQNLYPTRELQSEHIDYPNLPDPRNVWELEERVGEGTYGEVFAARNKETCTYAISCHFSFQFIPFYYFLKLGFLVYLFHPSTMGATSVYNTMILPKV